MKPRGLKERGVIWENDGGSTPNFTPIVIHTDNPGWHDASLGDIDGDGDIDIATKIVVVMLYHIISLFFSDIELL